MTDPTDEPTRTVEIPERTAGAISNRLPETEFDSVDDYIAFALEQLVRELDREETTTHRREPPDTDATDGTETGTAVQDRLESLGYL